MKLRVELEHRHRKLRLPLGEQSLAQAVERRKDRKIHGTFRCARARFCGAGGNDVPSIGCRLAHPRVREVRDIVEATFSLVKAQMWRCIDSAFDEMKGVWLKLWGRCAGAGLGVSQMIQDFSNDFLFDDESDNAEGAATLTIQGVG
jgi:hypothetical protein